MRARPERKLQGGKKRQRLPACSKCQLPGRRPFRRHLSFQDRDAISSWSTLLLAVATLPLAMGERLLMSKSLNACQQESSFTASLFHVVYTPSNSSATVEMSITSSIRGKVVFDLAISAYGYQFLRRTVDPCDMDLAGLCPMVAGKTSFQFNLPVDKKNADQIPSIAYNIPDLDAAVRVYVNRTSADAGSPGISVACLEAAISNGRTVNLLGVKWATAVTAGLALLSSAVVNGLGHFNAAAHVAANSLSLFSYFQAQAIIGLASVRLPPIVQAWTLNFQWSMGIIRINFIRNLCTWYQRSTGGAPSQVFNALSTVSVQVAKRSLAGAKQPFKRGDITIGTGAYIVYGIQRVAFQSNIESTNLFMTGLICFYILIIGTILAVAAFRGVCGLCARQNWTNKFLEFRNGWRTILKGILLRLALIAYPQMSILCLWEFTQVDSPAEVVLAVFGFFSLTLTLFWGATYILFADPKVLNKWGFLYIQFRASAYYFIFPTLGYILAKSMLIAFGQHGSGGIAQAVGLVIIEAAALISASVMRPWMDKSTNSFNIAICAVNFFNAICLMVFTNVLGAPTLIVGIFSIILFIVNAAFSLTLLIMLIISTTITVFRKDPDARYQIMADDRASFVKSMTQLTATNIELEALAATARGQEGRSSRADEENEALHQDGRHRMAYRKMHSESPSLCNRSGSSLAY
ncbi:hypothetical protein XA68_11563 [Ophiocordyceps unilateralis]|uniref:ML-like domain-containing protein n=1 Tax=Ophiocordyceps unilateralis TaxID=268505 RepID=A0A2A9PGL0_OPHUN|nr:hypothetical protein XA68_11563 [Ophiocordyceps unilateralis]